eukprot:SAG22_NODE_22039_length_252_cov_0.640523_1_plen_29_part_10
MKRCGVLSIEIEGFSRELEPMYPTHLKNL